MYLSTSTSTEDFPEMYLSTFQVLYKLYLSTDVLKYKVLLPGSDLDQCRVVRIWLCGGNKEGPGQELLAATHCIWTSAEWLGFDYVEATRKAQDRNYWRQLIASGPAQSG